MFVGTKVDICYLCEKRKAGGGERQTRRRAARKREKKKSEEITARGDGMRRMPGECGRKRSFARNLRQSAQSKERARMLAEEIKRHVVRIRIGSEKNTLGGRIRIPFDAPWPKYNAPLVRDPETPTQRCPRRARTDQTSSSTPSRPGPSCCNNLSLSLSLMIALGMNARRRPLPSLHFCVLLQPAAFHDPDPDRTESSPNLLPDAFHRGPGHLGMVDPLTAARCQCR